VQDSTTPRPVHTMPGFLTCGRTIHRTYRRLRLNLHKAPRSARFNAIRTRANINKTQYCKRQLHIPPVRLPPSHPAVVRARPSVRPPLALAPSNPSVPLPRCPRKTAGRGAGAAKFSGSSILHGLDAPFSYLGSTPSRHAIAATSISECNTRPV
jgi:hypothetical protein